MAPKKLEEMTRSERATYLKSLEKEAGPVAFPRIQKNIAAKTIMTAIKGYQEKKVIAEELAEAQQYWESDRAEKRYLKAERDDSNYAKKEEWEKSADNRRRETRSSAEGKRQLIEANRRSQTAAAKKPFSADQLFANASLDRPSQTTPQAPSSKTQTSRFNHKGPTR